MTEGKIEACATCKTVKYGGWAGYWCDRCEADTESVKIFVSAAQPRPLKMEQQP